MALSSVGTVSVRSPVTVVVPFICKVPVPLNVDPLSSVTFPSVNVAARRHRQMPARGERRGHTQGPALQFDRAGVGEPRPPLPNANSPLPAVLRNVPALVKVGVPHRLELKA